MSDENPFAGPCVLELMGHRRLGGYVQEVEFAGAKMIRIDIPADPDVEGSKPITQLYGGSSVYCLTPVGEDEMRAVAKRMRPEPVSRYEVERSKAIPAPDYSGPNLREPDYDDDGYPGE